MPENTSTEVQPIQPPDPCAMVILGASGDLTARLLAPALYNLSTSHLLPENFALIGVARAPGTAESWRDHLYDALRSHASAPEFKGQDIDETAWKRLAKNISYVQGDLTKPEMYQKLSRTLDEAQKAHGTGGNAIFYLAIADHLFGPVVDHLGKEGLTREPDKDGQPKYWRRVVVEKPFGHSLESARQLNAQILRTLREDQIFRIDHFLGKETVQNILALRFGNGMFEPIWNRDRVDHVQITAAETIGIEHRGQFYEATGALRDMVPNHLFELLALLAMEPPGGFDANSIRERKADVFHAMPPVKPDRAVRGQYAAGTVLGEQVEAYREEQNVAPHSNVETFAAIQVEIDNWRWAGVPFYLRTGKRMSRRKTEIAIRFKQAPFTPFRRTPVDVLPPNWLTLSIAPFEGICLEFAVKTPGPIVNLASGRMDFDYRQRFSTGPNVGYETLIYDVMIGDQTLFMRADMVEEAWRVVQPVLDAWASDQTEVPTYQAGSDGPPAAEKLISKDLDRAWRPVQTSSQEN